MPVRPSLRFSPAPGSPTWPPRRAIRANSRSCSRWPAMQFTHILDFMIMMPLGPQFMRTDGARSAAFRVPGVGVYVRGCRQRLRRRILDRPLRPQARAADDVCGLHHRDGVVRARPELSAAAARADRRGHVRRRDRRAGHDHRRRRRAVRATRAGHRAGGFGVILAGGGDGRAARAVDSRRMFSWRAPFLALAAFSVAVRWIGVARAAAARRQRTRRAAPQTVAQLRAIFGVRNHLARLR